MPFGYCGKILRVDLTNEVVGEEPLDAELAVNFLGQAGLAAKESALLSRGLSSSWARVPEED